jgi:hypothetical protein
VDGRDKPGHDSEANSVNSARCLVRGP